MKTLIVPLVVWGYTISVLFAVPFWSSVYTRLSVRWDLTPSQSWLLPFGFNVLFALIAIPYLLSYIATLRKSRSINPLRHVGFAGCALAFVMLLVGTIKGVTLKREELKRAIVDSTQDDDVPPSGHGNIAKDVYSNGEVGIRIGIPEEWVVLSAHGMERAHQRGLQTLASGGFQNAERYATAPVGVTTLLVVRRFREDYATFNPGFSVLANDKRIMQARGKSSIEDIAAGFRIDQPPYTVESGPTPCLVGNRNGYQVHLKGSFPFGAVDQIVNVVETRDSYIVITVSYQSQSDHDALMRSVASLVVTR